jgi:Asp-tRNA(Asn)/Glu-tRNA(Gln) amidotransferase A subunit family amidase
MACRAIPLTRATYRVARVPDRRWRWRPGSSVLRSAPTRPARGASPRLSTTSAEAEKRLLSTRGVVPACRSLDCVSVFALTARDASVVFDAAARFDPDDPLAREPDAGQSPRFGARLRFAVPPSKDLEFFGDTEAAFLFEQAIANLERIGGSRTEVAFATFRNAGRLLYEAPGWPSACMRPEHFSKKTRIQSFRWSVRLSRKAGTTVR